MKQIFDEKSRDNQTESDKLRLNLTGVLSHEMLTPLGPILFYSKQLMELGTRGMPAPEELVDMQRIIYDNASRLRRLLNNYLVYARILQEDNDAPGIWKRRQLIEPHILIPEWVTQKALKMGRQSDVRINLANIRIRISEKSLRKIMDELLDNAFKFSEPGALVRISSEADAQTWKLEVSDRGRGMTPDQVSSIGAFMQFDRERHEQQGVGLGLIIARLLTGLQQGEFVLTSTPNQGVTVTLKFPRNLAKAGKEDE